MNLGKIRTNKKLPVIKVDIKPYSTSSYSDNKFKTIKEAVIEDYEENDYDFRGELSLHKDKKTILSVDFSELDHCCGVSEIGCLFIGDKNTSIKEITEFLDSIAECHKGRTFIVNTNGIGHSVHFEQALSKCKYFTLIKTFVNIKSSHTIKVWVSNNE